MKNSTKIIISVLLFLFAKVINCEAQDLIFYKGVGNSNYEGISLDKNFGERSFENLVIDDGATGALTHKVLYVKNVILFSDTSNLILRGECQVFYEHAYGVTEVMEGSPMTHKLTPPKPLKDVIDYHDGVLLLMQNGNILALGTYEQLKDMYIKNGLYSLYSDNELVFFNKLVN